MDLLATLRRDSLTKEKERMLRIPPHGIWYVAGGCVAALAVLVVVLYVVPSVAPPPPVTILSIDWNLEQNPPVNGTPEFGTLWINQSGPFWGFPFHLRSGGSFNDSLVIINTEPYPVPICSATISPPLRIVSTYPALPMRAVLQEDNLLILTISADAGAGTVVNATGTIDALGCSLPPVNSP